MNVNNMMRGVGSAALLLLAALVTTVEAKTCLMMYQVADSNLEFYIRQDYSELSRSPLVKSENLRVWIYYDALNQGGSPVPNTLAEDGSTLSGRYTGGRYITYNRDRGALQVERDLSGEPDSDAVTTMQDFLEHAMDDCISDGFNSLMTVFSGHAGGFAGYGGDENKRRNLLQTNAGVARAVKGALDATSGAPDKVEVIGFDACNQQALEAADDFVDVAQYLLASEGLEPGHGWSYTFLSTATSALELAKQVVQEFLIRTQGGSFHQVPKTLAVVDLAKYETFLDSFETLADNLLSEMQGGDLDLHTFTARARGSSVTFEGILDSQGSQNPSSVDIGSFMQRLNTLCNPTGDIGTALNAAVAAYSGMFITRGVGPGTSPGTGMVALWPIQGEYRANKVLYDTILFQDGRYVTAQAENFREFLSWFLNNAVPTSSDLSNSVCGPSAQPPPAVQADPNALIIEDSSTLDDEAKTFAVEATIGAGVTQMLVEYALDLSTPLKPVLLEKGYEPQDDEYLILKGGDVIGTYEGSNYEAVWDQNFYFLNISGTEGFEALYTFDQGEQKRVPVMYFPEANRSAVAELQFLEYLFFDFDYWVGQGARYAFLTFSVNETVGRINDNLALYISNGDSGFSEQPKEAKGLLMPLIYIDAFIQGRNLDTLPGGFNQTVIEWNENITYNVLTTTASRIPEVIPDTDAVIVMMRGWNSGREDLEADVRYYDIIRTTRGEGESPLFTNSPVMGTIAPGATTADEQQVETESDSGTNNIGATTTAWLACIGVVLFALF